MSSSQINNIKFLFKDSFVYGGASAISKAFSLIIFPILIKNFTVSEYGTLDFLSALSSFLLIFLIFGQDSNVARFYYDFQTDKEKKDLISQSLFFQLLFSFLLIPFLWFNSEIIIQYFFNNLKINVYFKIILIQIPSLILINFSQNILKWTFNKKKFLIISLGYTFIQTIILFLIVNFKKINIIDYLLMNCILSYIFGIIGLYFTKQWLTIPKTFNIIRNTFSFSFSYGIICIITSLLPTLERSLTLNILGTHSLGIYATSIKIAMLIGLLVNAFQTAWGPFSLSIFKEKDTIQTYNLVLKFYTILLVLSIILVSTFSKIILFTLAPIEYQNAYLYIFTICLSISIQSIISIFEIGITYSKKSYYFLIINIITILCSFLFMNLLIPYYGIFGLINAVLFTQIIKLIITYIISQRVYFLNWEINQVSIILILTFCFSFFLNIYNFYFSINYTIYYILFFCLFFSIITIYYFISKNEYKFFKIYINKHFTKKLFK